MLLASIVTICATFGSNVEHCDHRIMYATVAPSIEQCDKEFDAVRRKAIINAQRDVPGLKISRTISKCMTIAAMNQLLNDLPAYAEDTGNAYTLSFF